MPIAERSAQTTWKGSLANGAGTLTSGSGALGELPVTWASRTERSEGKTSPEELIAAAHASCFSMALSNILAEHGHEPESVRTTVDVTLKIVDGTPTITKAAISTVGKVPGIDAAHFAEHAEQAKTDCIISRALAGISEITLETDFDG